MPEMPRSARRPSTTGRRSTPSPTLSASSTPEQIEALDSETLHDAVSRTRRSSVLRSRRMTSRNRRSRTSRSARGVPHLQPDAMMVKVEDGGLVQVTDFVDVATPPTLDFR